MKRTIAIIAITTAITSLCWSIVTGARRGVEELWLISAVKAPGRMALDKIAADLQHGNIDAASTKLQILRSEWERFEKEVGPSGAGIGNVMVEFSRPRAQAEK